MTRSHEITTIDDLRLARERLLRMHFKSGVGHIGGNLSALDSLVVLFREYLGAGDAFILSKGHAAGALYIALWCVGRLSDADLETFHQDGTLLSGHPPASGIDDILFATGSLGHGFSLAAGTALGLKLRHNAGRVICLTSDGEWQEGSTWEALIFAIHHRLANLTVLVDQNGLQGFGSVAEVASMAPLEQRLSGFAIHVEAIDGHDPVSLREAMDRAVDGPRIIVLNTTKGHGVSFMEDKMSWHYLPLDEVQLATAIEELRTS